MHIVALILLGEQCPPRCSWTVRTALPSTLPSSPCTGCAHQTITSLFSSGGERGREGRSRLYCLCVTLKLIHQSQSSYSKPAADKRTPRGLNALKNTRYTFSHEPPHMHRLQLHRDEFLKYSHKHQRVQTQTDINWTHPQVATCPICPLSFLLSTCYHSLFFKHTHTHTHCDTLPSTDKIHDERIHSDL